MAFVYGMITMGYIVAGLFFLKFWTRGRDPLFIIFALAFWLLAASQLLLAILEIPREEQGWVYILRLAAFALIIIAIIQKTSRDGSTGNRPAAIRRQTCGNIGLEQDRVR